MLRRFTGWRCDLQLQIGDYYHPRVQHPWVPFEVPLMHLRRQLYDPIYWAPSCFNESPARRRHEGSLRRERRSHVGDEYKFCSRPHSSGRLRDREYDDLHWGRIREYDDLLWDDLL